MQHNLREEVSFVGNHAVVLDRWVSAVESTSALRAVLVVREPVAVFSTMDHPSTFQVSQA